LRESIGSGFFVEPDLILTNAHVLCPPGEKIQAVLSDGQRMTGETVRSSQAVDLALVRSRGRGAGRCRWATWGTLALGDRIMMIGSPWPGVHRPRRAGEPLGRVVQGIATSSSMPR
jgi:serine protease Do